MRILVFIVGVLGAACASRAELRCLNDAHGQCVEVAIDFTLKKIEITQNGTVRFEACANEGGKDLGFIVVIDEPKAGKIGVYGGGDMPIMRAGIEFRSIGVPTSSLDQLIRDKLQDRKDVEEPYYVAGVYSALSSRLGGSLADVIILHANSVGVSYDESGKVISGIGFRTILVVDVPMARMTAYFSNEGGYGGRPPADGARENWLKKGKQANQALQHNDPSCHVSCLRTPRASWGRG